MLMNGKSCLIPILHCHGKSCSVLLFCPICIFHCDQNWSYCLTNGLLLWGAFWYALRTRARSEKSESLRTHCPSIVSPIAIELNVPHDDFSSIAIELTFVTLGHGLKKNRFSPL